MGFGKKYKKPEADNGYVEKIDYEKGKYRARMHMSNW